MPPKISTVLFGLLLSVYCASAQQSKVGNWLTYTGDHKISARWNWVGQANLRSYNFIGNVEQVLLRTGFGYNITENNHQVLMGYAFVLSEPYIKGAQEKRRTKEHRIFQQYIYRHTSGKVIFQHRIRPEERWIDKKFSFRMRYYLSLSVPLYGRKIETHTLYFLAFNEIFVSSVKGKIFDRNRTFAGLGFMFSEYMKLEMGLMYQVQKDIVRPQTWITFTNTLPFVRRM